MLFFKKKLPFYKQRRWIIAFSVIAFLVVFRMVLPTVVKISLNNYLKGDFSPSLSAHIDDIDLAILRGVYSAEDVTVSVKKMNKKFAEVKSVTASLAWRELFKGNVQVDVLIKEADINYFNAVIPAVQEHLASSPKQKDPLVRIARVDVQKSLVRTDMFPELTREQGEVFKNLELRATNVTSSSEAPLTPFSIQGILLGSGQVKVEGDANLYSDVLKWTVDSEIREFNLTALNQFLKKRVPLTFTKGKLDLYAEATSEGGPIKGYIKPFVKGLDVIRTKEKFVNTRHWLIELVTALGNVVMKSDQTMATKVSFTFDKEFKPDNNKAISKAFKHGFLQELNRGIENSFDLKDNHILQAQEEK